MITTNSSCFLFLHWQIYIILSYLPQFVFHKWGEGVEKIWNEVELGRREEWKEGLFMIWVGVFFATTLLWFDWIISPSWVTCAHDSALSICFPCPYLDPRVFYHIFLTAVQLLRGNNSGLVGTLHSTRVSPPHYFSDEAVHIREKKTHLMAKKIPTDGQILWNASFRIYVAIK